MGCLRTKKPITLCLMVGVLFCLKGMEVPPAGYSQSLGIAPYREESKFFNYDQDIDLTLGEKVIAYGGRVFFTLGTTGGMMTAIIVPAHTVPNHLVALLVGEGGAATVGALGMCLYLGFEYWLEKFVRERRQRMSFVVDQAIQNNDESEV
jgi:hypothetical protein